MAIVGYWSVCDGDGEVDLAMRCGAVVVSWYTQREMSLQTRCG